MSEKSLLDQMIADVMPHLPPIEAAAAVPSMRELFLELLTVSLGNLYGKMPLPANLYDRVILKVVADGMDDNDIAKMTLRGEDWLRLEGIIRAAEGQKAYSLNKSTMAVLSTVTTEGALGSIMERITNAYSQGNATPELRRSARVLGAYFLTRIALS
jgi:hypothetical protein